MMLDFLGSGGRAAETGGAEVEDCGVGARKISDPDDCLCCKAEIGRPVL